jgi:hypothetical protein
VKSCGKYGGKSNLNSENILKIHKKIVKRLGKYGKKIS